jgi:NRPS condensation-like uncharacterized protein
MKSEARSLKCGKLNTFQRTMLQWNELHPYNAVHVVRLFQPLELDRLSRAVNQSLERQGLTGWRLNPAQGTFRYAGGPAACELQLLGSAEAPRSTLAPEIQRQLNTPFTWTDHSSPFRFFVAPAADSFALGVVYFHPVADAESLVHLIHGIFGAYTSAGGDSQLMNVYPRPRDGVLQRPALLAKKLGRFPFLLRNMRESCRPPYRDSQNLDNGFEFFSLNTEQLQTLLTVAKLWGVTLNDLFLALLMKSLSPLTSARARARTRKKLSVGCIVNTRRDLTIDSSKTFGLFLGSFIISRDLPDGLALRELATDIGVETRAIKQNRLYLGMPLEMAFGRLVLPLFSTERRKKLYQKHYPLWGGITNMNLNSLWPQPDGKPAMDYLRAVSTGPVTPFVLSLTTVNEVINIGVTYRTTVFGPDEIQGIQTCFLNHITELNQAV